jgi:hypothetical protein
MIRNVTVIVAVVLAASAVAAANPALNVADASPFRRDTSSAQFRQRGWMAPDANPNHAWLYVSGNMSNDVVIVDLEKRRMPTIGRITQGVSAPGGLTIDKNGTLYVANESGSVTIYPAGSVAPAMTLTQNLSQPQSVTVDAMGNVYVCNRGASPSIVVYAPGQSSPSQIIANRFIQVPTQTAFDSVGDMYYGDNNTGVSEMAAGSSGTFEPLGLHRLQRTDGIAFDPLNGDLFVGTFGSHADAVRLYSPGDVSPVATLKDSAEADLFAIGPVGRQEFFFAPDSATDEVHIFDHDRRRPAATVDVPAAHYPVGVGLKPAGVP